MPPDTTEDPNIIDIFLQPGDFYWGDKFTRMRTLLGSCIGICVWHPRLFIGGMVHFMLPTRREIAPGWRFDPRYADEAVHMLLLEMDRSGTKPAEYQTKVFGGGNMFLDMESNEAVGDRNIAAAHALLPRYGFKVLAENVGGNFYWKLRFEVWSGDVWVRRRPVAELKDAV